MNPINRISVLTLQIKHIKDVIAFLEKGADSIYTARINRAQAIAAEKKRLFDFEKELFTLKGGKVREDEDAVYGGQGSVFDPVAEEYFWPEELN